VYRASVAETATAEEATVKVKERKARASLLTNEEADKRKTYSVKDMV